MKREKHATTSETKPIESEEKRKREINLREKISSTVANVSLKRV